MDTVLDELVLADGFPRAQLEELRTRLASLLPALAVVETLLGIPDEERFISRSWAPLPKLADAS